MQASEERRSMRQLSVVRRARWSWVPLTALLVAASANGQPVDEASLPVSDAAASALAAAAGSTGPITIVVSPSGDDSGQGTRARPFRTPQRAQQAVRQLSDCHDVTVELADGTYRLDHPLSFGTADGGRSGHKVVWTAAAGAQPVLSGAVKVGGWTLHDRASGIYIADVPHGIESRQLIVDGRFASRAGIEIARSDVAFTQAGLTILNPKLDYLNTLPGQDRIEVEGTGFFTDRFSPVGRIRGRKITMQQPSWNNNIWGYDTLANPHALEFAHLYLENALAFLRAPGQWFLDSEAAKIYYRPLPGQNIAGLDVELPRLPYLIGIAGTYDPVADLTFSGLTFTGTSWLGPLEKTGYADQQSGAFLADVAPDYPVDSLVSCKWGCPRFEQMRNEWSQIPAAIQVARATRVTFDRDRFVHLGQNGIGIGNDAPGNDSGIGLGAQGVTVRRSLFTDIAGGAISVGGVRRAAHHPSDPALVNRDILIENNRITHVSHGFRDNAAILSTYVTAAKILHNDISDVPYDGIDVGFGWGIQDVGGNPNYAQNMHGYDYKPNIAYQVPTTLRDTLVAFNRVHDAKQFFEDGGAIYNLSANPGAVIRDNYLYDLHGHIGLYLDEGSSAVTITRNVVDGTGRWLNDNTVKSAYPLRISIDNKAIGDWHNGPLVGGRWNVYQNDLILDDHPVAGSAWPAEARRIMAAAGIERDAEVPAP